MRALLIKELKLFLSSLSGYLIIGVYLGINGFFLWFFNGEYNILRAGFADLKNYFLLAPWILIFLVTAVTMRSFSDELNTGTLELLKTKPLTHWQIVLGKYGGAFILVILAILPTLTYVYAVYQLGSPKGNLELGATVGSFIGLLFLSSAYVSIGIFASTFSKNQLVSFIIGALLSFIIYIGFDTFASFSSVQNWDYFLQQLGMFEHYKSISKGVIDTRDLIYFISITFLFLFLTKQRVQNEN